MWESSEGESLVGGSGGLGAPSISPSFLSACERCLPPLLFLLLFFLLSAPLLFSPRLSSPSSRRGVSALRLPPPLPRPLPPAGAAGSLGAAAPQEDVSPGVSAALAASAAAAAAGGAAGGGPSGARRAAVRRRAGDHPGHVGAGVQELRGRGGVRAHKVSLVQRCRLKHLLLSASKLMNKRRGNTSCNSVCLLSK